MSSAKFASITAGLLARKGEAQPWNGLAAAEPEKAPLAWRPPAAMAADPPALPVMLSPAIKDRSCAVRMSAHDHERLGIIAVKTGSSRQQLLKDALAQFLDSQAQHYERSCRCLGTAQCATPCQA